MRKLWFRKNFSRILTICIRYQIYIYKHSGSGGSNGLFFNMVQTRVRFDACHLLTPPFWSWPFLRLSAYQEHWTIWIIVEDEAQIKSINAVVENIDIAVQSMLKSQLPKSTSTHVVFAGVLPVSVKWEVDISGGRIRWVGLSEKKLIFFESIEGDLYSLSWFMCSHI